jgi:cytochrome c peroxidase
MKISNPTSVPFHQDHLGTGTTSQERENLTPENPSRRSRLFTGSLMLLVLGALALIVTLGTVLAQNQISLPNLFPFPDPTGIVETFTTDPSGQVDLTGPFFQSLGTNGRSCGSCHVPSDGWTVSAAHVQARFTASEGLDPIFRTVDGSNCDHNIDVSTLAGRAQAYSLLRTKGLIRIGLSVPSNAEFTVVGVSNPYGCKETSPLSMYRRPLPAANLRFLSTLMFDGRESSSQTGTYKITYPATSSDPPTPLAALLLDLAHQAVDATNGHAQATTPLTQQQQQAIVNFETELFVAQAVDSNAGSLQSAGATGGPMPLSTQSFFIGSNDPLGLNPSGAPFSPVIFTLFNPWVNSSETAKASIARGQTIFNSKPISISGVAGLNDNPLVGGPIVGTCGTCHDAFNVGDHSVSAPLNIGVGDVTNPLGVAYLPVITLRNSTTGKTVQTTDPGRALITGKWADIGKVKGPILRGLGSRAPYFHNGSANTLSDVVNFYDQRFGIGFTAQEKADLVAFLSVL